MSSLESMRADGTMVMPKPVHLTLIVAATLKLGIGAKGALPWRLKSEMQYFARVTMRLPDPHAAESKNKVQNAMIMGRKTWESIPKKFRPLKDRLNIVLSSKAESDERQSAVLVDGAVWVKSLENALELLQDLDVDVGEEQPKHGDLPRIARAFVIGGANVYKAALDLPDRTADRVLLTRVYGDFDCDTFFPVALEGGKGEVVEWSRKSNQELSKWVHEDVADGRIKEEDVEFEYCMFERLT